MPPGKDVQAFNTRRVLLDGVGVAVATAPAAFLAILLARLGASDFAVGLLSAMPALAGLIFVLPISRFLARQHQIVPWYSGARLIVVAGYALSGLATLLAPDWRAPVILLIWALATIPQIIVDVCFTLVMAGAAGPNRRLYLMSRRWSSIGLVTAITVAGAGIALDQIPFPLGYQIVFPLLAAAGLFSFYYGRQIRLPAQETATRPTQAKPSFKASLAVARHYPKFVRFTAAQFVYRLGLTWVLPLIPLFYVHSLHANDAQIGLITTVGSAVLIVAYFMWTRISKRRGVRFALLATTGGLALYPLILSQTFDVGLVILLAGLAGIFSAGLDLMFFDSLVSSYPPESGPIFLGLYQTTVYVATFFAPLAATALAQVITIPGSLLVGGALRLTGFALFAYLGRKTPSRTGSKDEGRRTEDKRRTIKDERCPAELGPKIDDGVPRTNEG